MSQQPIAPGMADPSQPSSIPDAPAVLVVDDEAAIADLIARLLEAEGFRARACYAGRDAITTFSDEHFDLVILDIMMPDLGGFEVCSAIRRVSDVPIVFLSAKDEESDKVVGLTLGADDYVTKPFKPRELVARVRAHLRRTRTLAAGRKDAVDEPQTLLRAMGIELDARLHVASLHGVELRLTPKEFAILELLMRDAGVPVSTSEVFETVWHEPYDDAAANTVMVHVRRLRKKLAEIDSSVSFIETAWGVGYKMARLVPGSVEGTRHAD